MTSPTSDPTSDPTAALVEANDLTAVLQRVETLCEARDFPALKRLRDACRGGAPKLLPAAVHAEYRLALSAEGAIAGAIVAEATEHFSIGPLTEVAASTHTWAELSPHIPNGPARAIAAYERVLRGEDLSADRSIDTSVFDLPLVLQPWEPAYPVAIYEPWRGIFPPPRPLPALRPVVLPVDARPIGDESVTEALLELTRPWVAESNGQADAVAVQGDHLDALAALDIAEARVAPLPAAAALEIMAWTAASGGAHGRRRGMAAGRFGAWWAVAVLADLVDDWPLPPARLGRALQNLSFFAWDADEEQLTWAFRLAVVDVTKGLAWATAATDARSANDD